VAFLMKYFFDDYSDKNNDRQDDATHNYKFHSALVYTSTQRVQE